VIGDTAAPAPIRAALDKVNAKKRQTAKKKLLATLTANAGRSCFAVGFLSA